MTFAPAAAMQTQLEIRIPHTCSDFTWVFSLISVQCSAQHHNPVITKQEMMFQSAKPNYMVAY